MSSIDRGAYDCEKCNQSFRNQGVLGNWIKHNPGCCTEEERFWKRVQKGDGCWLYLGAKLPQKIGGYGWVKFSGKVTGAHRLSWRLTNGPIPKGKHVLHRCDNGPCVNPSHLFLGALYTWQTQAKQRRMSPVSPSMGVHYWICFQYGSPSPVPVLPLVAGHRDDLPRRSAGSHIYLRPEGFASLPARVRLPVLRAGAGLGLSGAWSVCGVESMRRSTSSALMGLFMARMLRFFVIWLRYGKKARLISGRGR